MADHECAVEGVKFKIVHEHSSGTDLAWSFLPGIFGVAYNKSEVRCVKFEMPDRHFNGMDLVKNLQSRIFGLAHDETPDVHNSNWLNQYGVRKFRQMVWNKGFSVEEN